MKIDIDIDDRWLDVDFTKEERYVFGDLGAPCFETMSAFEDSNEVYSDAKVRECCEQMEEEGSLEWLIKRIFNQGREGSCVGNAGTGSFMALLAEILGVENVIDLSPISLYKQIGRSASSGAMVSDAIKEMNRTGILPLDTPENRAKFGDQVMPATGFSKSFPANWKNTSKKFRAPEYDVIRTIEGLKTVACQRRPIVVGREGHSIYYVGIRYRNGRYVWPYANSWDEDWGQAMGTMKGGFGWDSESQAKKSASWAFTPRSATLPKAA